MAKRVVLISRKRLDHTRRSHCCNQVVLFVHILVLSLLHSCCCSCCCCCCNCCCCYFCCRRFKTKCFWHSDGYGLDGSVFESLQVKEIFCSPKVHTGSGAHAFSYSVDTGSSFRGCRGHRVKLTTRLG